MKSKTILHSILSLVLCGLTACAQELKIAPEQLQAWLKQYPAADTNKDGVLSETEARVFYAKMQSDAAAATKTPVPTLADVRYGPHERNTLDLWRASPGHPTPLVIYIYGGGFVMGDKTMVRSTRLVRQCLDAGVSVAAINYPYLSATMPLQDILRDCARAVQFLRAHAAEMGIDKGHIASCGNSAGAGTSMWLAFHPDMADPQNADPVLRESTRLSCAVSWDGQFSYDLPRWADYFGQANRQKFGGIYNSPGIYGLKSDAEVYGPVGQKLRAECDFYAMISPDDPPVYIGCGIKSTDVTDVNEYLHSPRHSQLLYDRCREQGVHAVAKIPALHILPDAGEPPFGEVFMFKYLKAGTEQPAARPAP